jgi:predicted acyltransferase
LTHPVPTSRAAADAAASPVRIVSIDALRGLTVALMILVNNPGSWAHVLPPLRHAAWHGCTPTDLVFPFFLFIVGVSMAVSFERRRAAGADAGLLRRRIVRRSALILALGLLLNAFPFGLPLSPGQAAAFTLADLAEPWTGLRLPGVLQRIALCYLAAGLIVTGLPGRRGRLAAAAGLAVVYELAMRLPLVPGWGGGSFGPDDNLVRWLDLQVLGANHMLVAGGHAFDPEGLLSTLPAVLTTLLGYAAAGVLRLAPGAAAPRPERARALAVWGAALTAAGWALAPLEPVNKQLWTLTYVLVTGGLAALGLAAAYWLLDLRGWRAWARPALVFGANPLLAFVGSGVLARLMSRIRVPQADGAEASLQRIVYAGLLEPCAGAEAASLAYALIQIAFWLAALEVLYRRRVYVRI